MKNLSELMVDLAYSAVLFNSKAAAEEVIELENEVNAILENCDMSDLDMYNNLFENRVTIFEYILHLL